MVLDANLLFSDDQAITADAVSTNVLDLGALGITPYNAAQLKHRVGLKEIPLLIQVTEDFVDNTSLTVTVQSDDNSGFTSAKDIVACTVAVAELLAGKIMPIRSLPEIKERYVRLNYTVNGADATAGKITAGIVLAVDGGYVGA